MSMRVIGRVPRSRLLTYGEPCFTFKGDEPTVFALGATSCKCTGFIQAVLLLREGGCDLSTVMGTGASLDGPSTGALSEFYPPKPLIK